MFHVLIMIAAWMSLVVCVAGALIAGAWLDWRSKRLREKNDGRLRRLELHDRLRKHETEYLTGREKTLREAHRLHLVSVYEYLRAQATLAENLAEELETLITPHDEEEEESSESQYARDSDSSSSTSSSSIDRDQA